MPENRPTRGVPVPSLWQVCVAAAAVTATWLLWTEFHRNDHVGSDPGEKLRSMKAMIDASREGTLGLDELTALSRSDDPRIRRNALQALAEMGCEAAGRLAAVRERFSDEDSSVRPAALAAFARICDGPDQIRTAAAGFLADPDIQVREFAARLLQAAGPSAIPDLIAVAHSESAELRKLVIRLLPEADKHRAPDEVNAVLRSLFNDPDAAVRLQAVKAAVGRGAAELDEIRCWLRDDDKKVVGEGISALLSLDPESAAAALPELEALLEDTTVAIWSVEGAVSHLKIAAKPLIPTLLRRATESDSRRSHFGIAKTLVEIGAEPADVVPILIPLLASQKEAYNNCWQAGQLLAQIDPEEARRQVASLIGRIAAREKEPMEHDDADLNALSGLGSQAQEAVPLLIRLLSHPIRHVRAHAMWTLHRLGPDAAPAVPTLLSLVDREPDAVGVLGAIGPAAQGTVPKLLKLIDDPNAGEKAAKALGQMGPASPEVFAALRRQLARDDSRIASHLPRLRAESIEALVLLDGHAATTLADVLPLLNDPERTVRHAAISATGRLSGDRRQAIEPLIKSLADDDNSTPAFMIRPTLIPAAAALALGQIGPDAQAALPALRRIVADRRNAVARSFQHWPNEKAQRQVSLIEAAQWAIAAIEAPTP